MEHSGDVRARGTSEPGLVQCQKGKKGPVHGLTSWLSSHVFKKTGKEDHEREESQNRPVSPTVPQTFGALQFRVVKANKFGLRQNRILALDIDEGILRSLTTSHKLRRTFHMNDIECVEKSTTDSRKIVVHFHPLKVCHNTTTAAHGPQEPVRQDSKIGLLAKARQKLLKTAPPKKPGKPKTVTQRPYDLVFADFGTRECFCEALQSLAPMRIVEEAQAPAWVPDSYSNHCMRCGAEFSITVRRHHCRVCGFIICGSCSPYEALLPDLGFNKPVRVCASCYPRIVEDRSANINVDAEKQQPFTGEAEVIQGAISAEVETPHRIKDGIRRAQDTDEKLETANEERTVDVYGFPVDDESFQLNYLASLDKLRRNWHKYLVLHTGMERTNALKRLVRRGIPPELRGQVWQQLSGSRKLREEVEAQRGVGNYYRWCLDQARNSSAVHEIKKDLHRTFPGHSVYETKEGLETLRRVLTAYSIHNETIGYCQSMNFISALILLFTEEEDAFWLLVTVVEKLTCIGPTYDYPQYRKSGNCLKPSAIEANPAAAVRRSLPLPGSHEDASVLCEDWVNVSPKNEFKPLYYYQHDLGGVHVDQAVFVALVKEKLPKVFEKLKELGVPLESLTVNWFLCLFVNTLPLETTLHVWDCVFSEGVKVLFRAGLALLKMNERLVLKARDFGQLFTFLKCFSHANLDRQQFIHTCFDSLLFGSFPLKGLLKAREEQRIVWLGREKKRYQYEASRSAELEQIRAETGPSPFSVPPSPMEESPLLEAPLPPKPQRTSTVEPIAVSGTMSVRGSLAEPPQIHTALPPPPPVIASGIAFKSVTTTEENSSAVSSEAVVEVGPLVIVTEEDGEEHEAGEVLSPPQTRPARASTTVGELPPKLTQKRKLSLPPMQFRPSWPLRPTLSPALQAFGPTDEGEETTGHMRTKSDLACLDPHFAARFTAMAEVCRVMDSMDVIEGYYTTEGVRQGTVATVPTRHRRLVDSPQVNEEEEKARLPKKLFVDVEKPSHAVEKKVSPGGITPLSMLPPPLANSSPEKEKKRKKRKSRSRGSGEKKGPTKVIEETRGVRVHSLVRRFEPKS